MDEVTSARAARRLIELGFDKTRVAVLEGGLRGLHRAGYQMEGAGGGAARTDPSVTEAPTSDSWQRVDVLATLRAGLAPHYTVEREIGVGGMAKVFLAQELDPPRQVAVKVLNPELSLPVFRRRFIREVELVSKLSHPNIVPILAADECLFVPQGPDGLCYYVMPYVEGASLRDRLEKDQTVPLAEALEITYQIADALSYAHAQGVIHRDIKPENILLSQARVLLADFGIARAVSAAGNRTLTAVGHPIGTPGYMSPEQLVGSRTIDARSDIYSLGCVVHEMLVGRPPLLEIVPREFESALRTHGENRWGVRRLERVVARALAATPAERFSRVDDFASALRAAARRRPIQDLVPFMDRRAVAGGAILVLAAAGVALLTREPSLDPRRVVVVRFEDLSGDPALAPFAHLTAHWATEALAGGGVVEVVPAATTGQLDAASIRELASRTGAGTVVLGSYYKDGDSVRFQAQIIDAQRGVLRRTLAPVAAPIRSPHQAAAAFRIGVAAAFDTVYGRRLAPH